MKSDLQMEEQGIDLPGQLSFFPEMETEDPAPHIQLQHPIQPPDVSQLPLHKIRILLCDVLMRFEGTLPEQWLFEIMVTSGYLNNFVYADAVGGLIDYGSAVFSEQDGERTLILTQTGIENAKKLRLYVPKLFRDQVHLTALRFVARQRALRDLRMTYEVEKEGCRLAVQCTDRGKEMFFLRISAPSKAEAESIGESILRNPAGFFGKILDLALTNEEEPFDLTDN